MSASEAARRTVLLGACVAALGAVSGCDADGGRLNDTEHPALLAARPGQRPPKSPITPGSRPLGAEQQRDSLVYVPATLTSGEPAPLLVSLHGAGGDAAGGSALLTSLADQYNAVILSPASRGSTWDAIRDSYGPDVGVLERSLEEVFRSVAIDPERIGIAGFSDGASYALGLGLANGGLFRRILAFSPGFIPVGPRSGQPEVFVSHGIDDTILPIRSTSHRIVPALKDDGYDVTYREFEGPHTVPAGIVQEAAQWLDWTRSAR
ncbi:alpha/beta hydrolase [Arthrobacter sp. CAN_A214]|uniref:alpha/beta hydrolase n=1 Tax=Arthrobacter sp. CAN_A214 TaxID=2787720 RepID=UPI0018CA8432